MANIDEYIKQIQQARYGEEVRDSIVNALKKVNDDNNSYVAIKKEVVAAKDIVEEKAEIFDEKANAAKETLTALQASTQIANEAKSSLNNIISSAISTKKELEQAVLETGEVIARVDNAKSNLDKSITSAGKAELNLQRQIETSNQIKNQLDVSNNTAIELKKNLDVAINEANTAKVKLVEAINNAGNAALEKIETAQSVATRAVETAKVEAVKAITTAGTTETKKVTDEGAKQVQTVQSIGTQETEKVTAEGTKQVGLVKTEGEKHLAAVQTAAQEIIADREQITKNKTDIADLRQKKADAIVETASGTLLNVKDSSGAFFEDFSMSGKTTQDGAPTPDTPVEIVNAGEDGAIEIKVTGKNLLPFPYLNINEVGKTVNYHGVDYTVLQDRGVHLKGTPDGVIGVNICKIPFKEYGKIATSEMIFYDNNNDLTFFYLPKYVGKAIDMVVYPQVECGTVATSYEPYRETQTITLTLDRPITKWDKLVEQDGQIGWLYKGKQYIVTGEEPLRIPTDVPSYIYGNTTSSFLNISSNDFSDNKGYLNKLSYIYQVWASQSNEEGYCLNGTKQLHVRFANTRLNIEDTASISEREKAIKSHIKQQYDAGTPYVLWYESLQEEFVPLPQEQQEAIRALTTYYPTTVVSNSEDAEMELSYVADTKNYTDRKIEEAVTAQTQNLANLLSLMPLSTQAAMIENDTNNILDMEVQK